MVLAPVASPTLKPHQTEMVERLLTHGEPRGGINGILVPLPPRYGKSVSTVESAWRLGKQKILVVSPVTIIDGWVEEIEKWWSGTRIPVQKAHGRLPEHVNGWTLTNYETIRSFTHYEELHPQTPVCDWLTGYDLIILDESVKIKNPNAQLTKAIWALCKKNRQAAVWLLSGNPAPKDLSDLWAQLRIVDPAGAGESYWRFAEKYCVVEDTQWGQKVTGNQPMAETRIRHDFHRAFWSPSNLPALTPMSNKVIEVPLEGEQLRIYMEMEVRFRALLDQMRGTEILAPNVMVQAIRLLQIASNPALVDGPSIGAKWRTALDQVRFGNLQKPVIIWTAFKRTVELLGNALPGFDLTVDKLTGDTSTKERTAVRHRFQNGETDILLAHPGVGRFGLNLSAANSIIWLEKSWEGDAFYQAGFRASHLDKHTTVNVLEILATANGEPTIDHAVHNVLHARRSSSRKLTAADIIGGWHR